MVLEVALRTQRTVLKPPVGKPALRAVLPAFRPRLIIIATLRKRTARTSQHHERKQRCQESIRSHTVHPVLRFTTARRCCTTAGSTYAEAASLSDSTRIGVSCCGDIVFELANAELPLGFFPVQKKAG
jgi:hypothetical protein